MTAGSGGSSDFVRFYEETVPLVYGFVAYRVTQRQEAEDLTQLTFERALRSWHLYDSARSSERTWVMAIARNLLIDHYRKSGRVEAREPEQIEQLMDAGRGEEDAPAISAELSTALASLDQRAQELVALRYGSDLTGPEIASITGLRLSNVQQILSRSLRKLRGAIG